MPDSALADAAGLADAGERGGPLRLNVSAMPAHGLAGEMLPVVGPTRSYTLKDGRLYLGLMADAGTYEFRASPAP